MESPPRVLAGQTTHGDIPIFTTLFSPRSVDYSRTEKWHVSYRSNRRKEVADLWGKDQQPPYVGCYDFEVCWAGVEVRSRPPGWTTRPARCFRIKPRTPSAAGGTPKARFQTVYNFG